MSARLTALGGDGGGRRGFKRRWFGGDRGTLRGEETAEERDDRSGPRRLVALKYPVDKAKGSAKKYNEI